MDCAPIRWKAEFAINIPLFDEQVICVYMWQWGTRSAWLVSFSLSIFAPPPSPHSGNGGINHCYRVLLVAPILLVIVSL